MFILFAGWHGWFNSFADKPETWFQRCGSLMTIVLLVLIIIFITQVSGLY
jgi:hypothetical protein